MKETPKYSLEETFKLLGLNPANLSYCRNVARQILPNTTAEPDWKYARVEVRERESGCPELVILVPFGIKGL